MKIFGLGKLRHSYKLFTVSRFTRVVSRLHGTKKKAGLTCQWVYCSIEKDKKKGVFFDLFDITFILYCRIQKFREFFFAIFCMIIINFTKK